MRNGFRTSFGVGVVLLLGGCQQESHDRHHHPPSEHVRDADQDFVPGRIKSAFHREFPDGTMVDTEKQTHPDGAVHWEVTYRTEDGQQGTAEFDTDGRLVTGR